MKGVFMKLRALFLCALLIGSAGTIWAQSSTTGSLSGVVEDAEGLALPGVTVIATHVDTGATYTSVADANGLFRLRGLRTGAYSVLASMGGFKDNTATTVVRLGEDTYLDVTMQLEEFTGELIVIGEASELITPTKMGSGSYLNQSVVDSLPKIDRSITDLARTNPLFNDTASNDGPAQLSVAGRNNRYNNIQIDGAVNNDLFGLAAQGTPGGQADTQPISIDAIAEMALVVSPYDVRQGGFSGGGVNIITRSGSNDWKGSVYGFYYDDSLVGDGPSEDSEDYLGELGTFEEQQYGFRLSGPIMKDQLFFFLNGEFSRLERPTGYSLDGNGGQCFDNCDSTQDAIDFRNFLINEYGYDPGGLSQPSRNTDSDKFFVRFDWNVNERNNLTFRHNYVDATNVILSASSSTYTFPNAGYDFKSETNSTVAQLNSVIGDDMFNEARLTYQTIRDNRKWIGDRFPSVFINNLSNTSSNFSAGSEDFSTANALDQDILEIHNDFSFFVGDHEVVVGTHNEFYKFSNLFIQQAFGAYSFNSIEDFYAGNAYQYDYTFSNDSSPRDEFKVQQFGLYGGDTWRVRSNVTLNYGLRFDVPFFPDSPQFNQEVYDTLGYRTDDMPDGKFMFSPRVGFNWDITGKGEHQLRGGIGLFSGRTPYVWLSNNFGRSGLEQTTIRANGDIAFIADPDSQYGPDDLPGVRLATQEINIVDPDFEFPQIWRASLGYDMKLPWWGLVGTAEAVYSFTEKDVLYQNANLQYSGETFFDGRPIYEDINDNFTGAYYLTNTDEGDATNLTLKLEKPYDNGWWGFVAYAWGESNNVNDTTSSRAVSNWRYNPAVDPNNPDVATSGFEVQHRITASIAYTFNRDSRWSTTLSGYFNRQSGRPFSLLLDSSFPSINGDGYDDNDLFYIPASADEVIIVDGTYEDLMAFISRAGYGDYKGKIAERNASRAPWNGTLDVHVGQQIPMPYGELELTLDIFNFLNLFDDNAGRTRYVSFGTVSPAFFAGYDEDTGKPIYDLNSVTDPERDLFSVDNLRSRWRAKLGLRYSF
jgi:hypothetical protein